jgi:ABC-type lipoprotein release transport system permease subunit
VLAGASIGVLVAMLASRALGSLLFDVDPLDGTTYGAVIGLVALVVAAAAYVPARRAAGIDPAVLFRAE